jgi:hypothetical protein
LFEGLAVNEDAIYPRFASRGRTFVYVLPCREADILKVGFSRDPLDRFRTLHRRFFEFFDLERGLLIDTDHLGDARRIERLFITTFADSRAAAPLVIPQAAAGHTEWFRGVSPQVDALARQVCAEQSLTLHAPLSAWLRERFGDWSELLFGWSARMLEMIEYEHFNVPAPERIGRADAALREVLDACSALDMAVEDRVPPAVLAWYRGDDYFGR